MTNKEIAAAHFAYAKSQGWLPHFKEASLAFNFPVALLMAVASRETNMKNIRGDFRGGIYHGYGVMQVDIGTHRQWCVEGRWKDAREAIKEGTRILAQKRDQMKQAVGKRLSVRSSKDGRSYPFTGPSVKDADFLKVLVPMYNAGLWPLYSYSKGNDPDQYTTKPPYGADVLERMKHFTSLLQKTSQREIQPAAPIHGMAFTSGVVAAHEVQPVAGGGVGDPSTQVQAQVPSSAGSTKSLITYITTAITGLGVTVASAWGSLTSAVGNNPKVMGALIAGLVVAIVAYWKYQDRQTRMDLAREQQAHEINKLSLTLAADREKINVELVPHEQPAEEGAEAPPPDAEAPPPDAEAPPVWPSES